MSSNPLYGLRKVGIFVRLNGLPGQSERQPLFAGSTRRLCDRRLWLGTKSTLEVYVVHDDTLYKLTTFTFYLYKSDKFVKTIKCDHKCGNMQRYANHTVVLLMPTSAVFNTLFAYIFVILTASSNWKMACLILWILSVCDVLKNNSIGYGAWNFSTASYCTIAWYHVWS